MQRGKGKQFVGSILAWLAHPRTVRDFLATLAFGSMLVGLWMERESLALIVGGGIVFGSLTWNHLRRERRHPLPRE